MGAGVVRRGERPDYELARFDGLDCAADFFNEAAVLVPHRRRPVDRLQAPVRPEVRSAHAGRGDAEHGIGRFENPGVFTLFEAHITRAVKNCSSHTAISLSCLMSPAL